MDGSCEWELLLIRAVWSQVWIKALTSNESKKQASKKGRKEERRKEREKERKEQRKEEPDIFYLKRKFQQPQNSGHQSLSIHHDIHYGVNQ